ncbi:MAG: hypothetical protein DRP32_03320 [Thermotogae bacterium]|uniref:Uncharacterized protein n=1 Tax=Kosmotoga arenicorallina TaxID=688066 RepID=A0A7C5E1P5_9BACT|nr:hypothetical protein [Kosmotoga sp.]MBO8167066.1 hypothetical protein [Kosmotoga sp.]MCD6159574.1 hypothetical protein [Kosmotoga sp.]RKX50140.1 MAG: hypothetical protein DRP32_03320 [Thermotogota bacterium]HHF08142.1 hypothetical protein [Kosmotoga arenicorallina]
MSTRLVTILLTLFATLMSFIAINTIFGFFLTIPNPVFGVIIFINALVYFYGLLESRDYPKRRKAHLLIGSYFSYLLALFQILFVLAFWLNGKIEGYCNINLQSVNFPLVISGLIASFVNDYVKKAYN